MATKLKRPRSKHDPGQRKPTATPKRYRSEPHSGLDHKLAEPALTPDTQAPDVEDQEEANVGMEFTVVKSTLNSFCTELGKLLPWEDVLADMNKAVLEAYVLANIHIARLCREGGPLPELNQTFFQRCLSAVTAGAHARRAIADTEFRQTLDLYHQWRDAEIPLASSKYLSSGWHAWAAREMRTNTKNSLKLNFFQRFLKMIKRTYHIDGYEAYDMLRKILAPQYDGPDLEIRAWRAQIPRSPNGQLNDTPHALLPLTYVFLADIEEWNRRFVGTPGFQEIRTFSLLPYKDGFTCSHFKMCKYGLRGLLQRAGVEVPAAGNDWNEVADEYWRVLFRIDRFETSNRRFAGQIVTDGKAVSILSRKPTQDSVARMPREEDFDIMWGLDPGYRDLFVAMNQLGEKRSCSTREFYEDARYTSSQKKREAWQDQHVAVSEAVHHMPTKKTTSLASLERYVRYMIPRMDRLLNFYRIKPFRKLRLRCYIYAKKKLRALCLVLTELAGQRTVEGFGNWSNNDTTGRIRGHKKAPVKKLERELKRYCTAVSIDEFRASKLHSRCCRELSFQFSKRLCKDGIERTCKIYSVLHCGTNGCRSMTVNRDVNASENMLKLFQHQLRGRPRPRAFSRGRAVAH